jgi:hypothetical protein
MFQMGMSAIMQQKQSPLEPGTQHYKVKNAHTVNFLVALTVIIPILTILRSCGGNIMEVFFIALSLIPMVYIFVKFF